LVTQNTRKKIGRKAEVNLKISQTISSLRKGIQLIGENFTVWKGRLRDIWGKWKG
jgi:hypothetical protein